MPDLIRVKTASWSTQLPDDHLRIGISRGLPRFKVVPAGWRRYTPLNPGPWLTAPDFPERYLDQLSRLDPQQVLKELMRIAGGRVPVLVCFERVGSGQWCHRSLVASWLAQSLGIEVPEVGYESAAEHPLRQPAPGATLFP